MKETYLIRALSKGEKLYGVSSKFEFGEWHHRVELFTDLTKAYVWLGTEENDFRERELMTRSAAIKLVGTVRVRYAEEQPIWSNL